MHKTGTDELPSLLLRRVPARSETGGRTEEFNWDWTQRPDWSACSVLRGLSPSWTHRSCCLKPRNGQLTQLENSQLVNHRA